MTSLGNSKQQLGESLGVMAALGRGERVRKGRYILIYTRAIVLYNQCVCFAE